MVVHALQAKAAATTVTQRSTSVSSVDPDLEKAEKEATNPLDLTRERSRTEAVDAASVYEASPYDIDRVNTKNSVSGV